MVKKLGTDLDAIGKTAASVAVTISGSKRKEPKATALADSHSARLSSIIADMPTVRLAQAVEPLVQLSMRIDKMARAVRVFREQPEIIAFLKKTEAIHNALTSQETAKNIARFQQQSAAISRTIEAMSFSTGNLVSSLSSDLAHVITPFQTAISSISRWQAVLDKRMAALDTAWVLPDHLGDSLMGFARLVRLSDAAHSIEPYGEAAGKYLSQCLRLKNSAASGS